MRIARFEVAGAGALGSVHTDVCGATWITTIEGETDPISVLTKDVSDLRMGASVPLDSVILLPPVEPRSLRDFVGFEQHVEGMVMLGNPGARVPDAWYEAPAFYFSNATAVIPTGAEVEVPPACEQLDYELEVAAIVGVPCRDLTLDSAGATIVGYTILNDWSARDLQRIDRHGGMGWSKSKDFASTLGPWVVSAGELERYRTPSGRLDLAMRVWLNGVEMGSDSLANLGWSFDQMLVYASRGTYLYPGDVIGSGTCGAGCLAELWGRGGELSPPALKPGDVVRMSVDGIGTIENTIVQGTSPRDYGQPARRGSVG